MKIYKTIYRPKHATINGERRISWTGSGAMAARAYKALVAEHGKPNVEKPESEEIPTSKPGLLKWLNENLVAVD